MSFLKTSAGNIYYEVAGNQDAAHTLVMAHGNGNCVADWYSLGYVDKLGGGQCRLLMMDALGYGQSDKPKDATEYTPNRRADDVIAVMREAGIASNVHFFGNSVGGALGFILMQPEYRDNFSSYIVGAAHPYGTLFSDGGSIFPEAFRNIMLNQGMEAFVVEMEEKFLKRRFIEKVRVQYLKNDPEAMAAANTPEWPDVSSALSGIDVPVTLYAGEEDPVVAYQYQIAKEIGDNANVMIIPGIDHAECYWGSSYFQPVFEAHMARLSA